MDDSLRCVDLSRQPYVDYRSSARLLWAMAHEEEDRKALGRRLKSARSLTGMTIEDVGRALTALGYPITKQAIGHWESGRNVPDALWLRRLAKLYKTTLDALVWDDSLTIEAIQIAAQYDGLTERQKSTWRVLWVAYLSDAAIGQDLPLAPSEEPEHEQQQEKRR